MIREVVYTSDMYALWFTLKSSKTFSMKCISQVMKVIKVLADHEILTHRCKHI